MPVAIFFAYNLTWIRIMWNVPTPQRLSKIPRFYETEEVALDDKLIHLHFFIGGCDWWIAEYSPEDQLFFGFACLNNDWYCAEWGYVSFDELKSFSIQGIEIDCELEEFWTIRPFREVIAEHKQRMGIK